MALSWPANPEAAAVGHQVAAWLAEQRAGKDLAAAVDEWRRRFIPPLRLAAALIGLDAIHAEHSQITRGGGGGGPGVAIGPLRGNVLAPAAPRDVITTSVATPTPRNILTTSAQVPRHILTTSAAGRVALQAQVAPPVTWSTVAIDTAGAIAAAQREEWAAHAQTENTWAIHAAAPTSQQLFQSDLVVDDRPSNGHTWTNPDNAEGNNAAIATSPWPGAFQTSSSLHHNGAMPFNQIPYGARVKGFQLDIRGGATAAGANWRLQLCNGAGALIGSPKNQGITSPGPVTNTLGGPADLWGTTGLRGIDVRTNLAVDVAHIGAFGGGDAQLAWFALTVFW